ncbi:structural maintenance of chromosomes 6B, partial [Micractinium conductrix]
VINFMCHEHLKMDFANLIRSGTDEAVIRVTVWNKPYKGHDAFRHGVFGDTITVERRISQNNNSSAYTLKDAAGRVHGRRRDDLDSMLTTLGLNAANPVCVMTQDTARNFLAGSSSKADQEKYQLYMEATSLEQIAFSLQTAKAQIRQMEEGVEQIREEYDKMCTEHAELKKSIAALEGIQGWRAEVAQLEQVLCWSVVEEHASTLTAVQAALDSELPRLLAEAEGQLGDLKREQAALTEAVEGKSKFLTSYNERSIELLAEQDGLRARHREAHRAVKAAELKLTSLREALTEAQAQKENLESAAREVQDDTFAATQAAVAEYQRQLQEAQEAQDAVQQEAAHLDAAHRAAQDSSKAAHQRAEDVSYQRDAAQRHMQALERDIVQLRSAGRNKLAGFGGQPAVRLVEAIKRASGQFSRPPIGPLGVHLALEDPTWGLAVESAIGRFLESYLVNSMEDSRLLRRMIDQHFQGVPFKPTVYVARFDLPQHTVPPAAQPPPSVPTVYRLLSCTDRKVAAPVMNILVDLAHIEKTALGSDLAKCKQAGWETPNVVACFSIDGEKFYRRGSTTTVVPRNRWVRGARLGQSAAQQARNAVQAANGEETCARKALQHARREEWEAKTQLTQLTQQPPPETLATQQREGGDDVQADIWEATQACIEVGQQLRDKQAALEEASEAWRASGATIADNKAAMDRLEEEHAEFAATYEPEVQKRSQVEMQVQEVEEYAEQLRCKQALYQQRCQQMVEEVTELEGCAAMVCSREEAAEARCAAEARLRSKQELSEEEVAALLSKDAQYAVSQARMQREGRAQREVLRTYQVLHEAAQLRTRKLQELDHNLEALVNTKFRHYMWKKGHSGTIKLDRKARSLQLQVRMNAKQIGGARGERGGAGAAGEVRDLKQLSGGERSYTTVAFTLALGGQTEMPFRAMDEFDVFMDAVNRRVAMQNLFSFARDNPELQFIFLSPQDMAAVEDARQACLQSGMQVLEGFVRVVQMRPPRANAVVA